MTENKKLSINICILIYNYFGDIERYNLTKIIFKHYNNIKKKFENKTKIEFTIIGSELDFSKKLTLEYFSENEYFEFEQNVTINDSNFPDFMNMLNKKINYGFNLATRNEPDIILWAGSNDYISFDFFEQIIDYHNHNNKQIYGIDNYNNGQNSCFFCYYNNIDKTLDIHNEINSFWWNGKHQSGREHYNYIGGIIGINKKIYKENPEILSLWNADEGDDEFRVLNIDKIDKFNSKNLFYMNIKIKSNNDISKLDTLKYMFRDNFIKFNDFDDCYKQKINLEVDYLINLIKNNI